MTSPDSHAGGRRAGEEHSEACPAGFLSAEHKAERVPSNAPQSIICKTHKKLFPTSSLLFTIDPGTRRVVT